MQNVIALVVFFMIAYYRTVSVVAAISVLSEHICKELHYHPTLSLVEVVNYSINCTLSLTILSSVTTAFTAVSLYCFGARMINDLVPILYLWHKGDRRTVEMK